MISITRIVFLYFFLLIVLLSLGFLILWDRPRPLFSLQENGYNYHITKSSDVYYIVRSSPNIPYREESPFHGDAMRIHTSKVKLDQYLDQYVEIDGKFTVEAGLPGYNIVSIKIL